LTAAFSLPVGARAAAVSNAVGERRVTRMPLSDAPHNTGFALGAATGARRKRMKLDNKRALVLPVYKISEYVVKMFI